MALSGIGWLSCLLLRWDVRDLVGGDSSTFLSPHHIIPPFFFSPYDSLHHYLPISFPFFISPFRSPSLSPHITPLFFISSYYRSFCLLSPTSPHKIDTHSLFQPYTPPISPPKWSGLSLAYSKTHSSSPLSPSSFPPPPFSPSSSIPRFTPPTFSPSSLRHPPPHSFGPPPLLPIFLQVTHPSPLPSPPSRPPSPILLFLGHPLPPPGLSPPIFSPSHPPTLSPSLSPFLHLPSRSPHPPPGPLPPPFSPSLGHPLPPSRPSPPPSPILSPSHPPPPHPPPSPPPPPAPPWRTQTYTCHVDRKRHAPFRVLGWCPSCLVWLTQPARLFLPSPFPSFPPSFCSNSPLREKFLDFPRHLIPHFSSRDERSPVIGC
ncbi:hypothetical protein C7M84_016854 [Penaeus vannamei]|uniref:Uncharacterized protein n=1 Tax=Penaeus vannamei TaxID=6689 RepID=A0A423SM00_PENVA|nr:hypothetical protein C7M84_016854 [Penaeus vannamei]